MPGPGWGPRGTAEHRTKVILCLAGVRLSKEGATEGNNLSSLGLERCFHPTICLSVHSSIHSSQKHVLSA